MKKALITGAAGFLGSNLSDTLLAKGYFVYGVDNYYTGRSENIKHLESNENFKFIEHNIINPIEGVDELDYIYNMACPASPPHYQKDPLFTLDTCYLGSKNMLELAAKTKAIYLDASTSEVYGDPIEHPQKETYWGNVNPFGIRSCYDEGKRITETLSLTYKQMFDVKIKVIRIFNTYGPRMDPKDGRVVSNFIVQALKGEPITIYGNGGQTRSFCFVSDLIHGIVSMMEGPEDFTGPVNLGTTFEFTVKQLAEKILELTGSASTLSYKDLPKDDPKIRKPDITLANEKLGWYPKVEFEDGLKKTIEYFKTQI